MLKRITALLLSLIFLLYCCGCKQSDSKDKTPENTKSDAQVSTSRDIKLLYCNSDTLNPYTCQTKYNQDLCDLLYDPLIKLDENYAVQNCLSKNIEAAASSVAVTLKSANFSNGVKLSASDVLYSFELAKSLSQYKKAFAGVNCKSEGNKVVFLLNSPDTNFVNFLDFPIIQANSDNIKNSDNVLQPPVGCGRYIYKSGENILAANNNYHNGKVNINKIHLIDTPDSTAAEHHLEVGAVDYYYSSLSDDEMPKLSGTGKQIVLNKIVYLGMNQGNALLKNSKIRHTLSAAVNRASIVNTAFHSDAVAAKNVFNPNWEPSKGYQYTEEKENINVVLANLQEIGYNNKDSEGYFVNKGGKRLSFSLICPASDSLRVAAAELLKTQFKKAGIQLNIEILGYSNFVSRLNSGRYQLYLAEAVIPQNMDISSFSVPNGSIAYGVVEETALNTTASSSLVSNTTLQGNTQPESAAKSLSGIIAEYKADKASIFDVITIFNATMPVIPLCFRCGISISASDFDIAPYATSSDVFYNIENATFK